MPGPDALDSVTWGDAVMVALFLCFLVMLFWAMNDQEEDPSDDND